MTEDAHLTDQNDDDPVQSADHVGGDAQSSFGGSLDEYSVGPLNDETWLVLYEMLSMAYDDAPENMQEEYRRAREAFLDAHPDEATGDPEDWPESMTEAWNETILEEIRDV